MSAKCHAPQWMWCVVGMVDVVCVGLGGCGENAPQWCVLDLVDVVKMHLSGCGACWMW